MTQTNVWLGTSLGNFKSIKVSPGPNLLSLQTPPKFSIGLANALFSFAVWNTDLIIAAWKASTNPDIENIDIQATGSGTSGPLLFTSLISGTDFNIVCTTETGVENSSSTIQQLVFDPLPSGGTFTLTVTGLTTGNISYNADPTTFATNMQTAIAALPGFGANDVTVTYANSPGAYRFDFSYGQFLGELIPLISGTYTSLTGGDANVTVTVLQNGHAAISGTSQINTLSFPINGTHNETQNAIQTIDSQITSGTFTISISGYGTTGSIPYDGKRADIQTAMDSIVGIGNSVVTGGPLYYAPNKSFNQVIITFTGTLAATAIPTMTIAVALGARSCIQTIGVTGLPASGGTYTLSLDGQTTSAIALTATASTLQTALQGLSTIGSGNATVTGGPLVVYGSPASVTPLSKSFNVTLDSSADSFGMLASGAAPIPYAQFTYTPATNVIDGGLLLRTTLTGHPTSSMTYTLCLNTSSPVTFYVQHALNVNLFGGDLNAVYPNETAYNGFNDNVNVSSFFETLTSTVASSTDGFGNTQYVHTFTSTALGNNIIGNPAQSGYDATKNNVIESHWTYVYNSTNPFTIKCVNDSGIDPAHTGNTLASKYCPQVAFTAASVTITPYVINFVGALLNTAVDQLISVDSLTGGHTAIATLQTGNAGIMTPTQVSAGGVVSAQNIKGGTFGLVIAGKVISGLAYNITATALATAINNAFGSTVVAVTGGPAPGTAFTLTFSGALATQPINIQFLNALNLNTAGAVQQTVVQQGQALYTPVNCWDINVIPGNGTLGINALAQLKIIVTNPAIVNNTGGSTPLGNALLNLIDLEDRFIEAAINEILAADACRVTRVSHSLEYKDIAPTGGTNFEMFWYMSDVYRVVFAKGWETIHLAASLSGTTFISETTAADTGDQIDNYPEVQRVVLGMTGLSLATASAAVTVATSVPKNTMKWRFKLIPQYNSDSTNYVGYATPPSGQVSFTWGIRHIATDGTVTFNGLVSSELIDWDSPISLFQKTISDMFFGNNVVVTGQLRNSWTPESTSAGPVLFAYQDLQVTLINEMAGMNLDDYGYTLQMNFVNQTFESSSSSFQKDFQVYGDFISRTIPPHYNHRERVSVSSPQLVSDLRIGCCNLLADVPGTAAAFQMQQALDALFPEWVTLAAKGGLPDKLKHPIYVYGTSFADNPIDFEFTSGGGQDNPNASFIVSALPIGVTIAIVGTSTAGVLAVAAIDALQLVQINGSPYSGTWTLSWGGHTTSSLAYNEALSDLSTAVTTANFSSPTITGDYVNGFTFRWAGSGGARATITAASTLNNVGESFSTLNVGGIGASFLVTALNRGGGPNNLDDKANFSLGRCLNTGDIFIVDDSPSAIMFGLELTGIFTIQSLATNVPTIFAFNSNRQIFDDGQVVVFRGTGTAPTGMTFGTTYVVALNGSAINMFTLTDTSGAQICCSAPGKGTFWISVENLVMQVNSGFTGGQIGLPHVNGDSGFLESNPTKMKAGFNSIDIGIGTGTGVSLIAIDTMDQPADINIRNTANTAGVGALPAVLLIANNASTDLTVQNGSVGVAYYAPETSVLGDVVIDQGTLNIYDSTLGSISSNSAAKVIMVDCTVSGKVDIG